jgi:hypothetical protein
VPSIVPRRVERGGIVEIHNPFAGENGNTSRIGIGAGREMASCVREFEMVVGAERLLSRTLDLLGTDMVKAIRKVLQELVTGSGTTRRGTHLTDTERGKVKGNKVRRDRGEKRKGGGGIIVRTHQAMRGGGRGGGEMQEAKGREESSKGEEGARKRESEEESEGIVVRKQARRRIKKYEVKNVIVIRFHLVVCVVDSFCSGLSRRKRIFEYFHLCSIYFYCL